MTEETAMSLADVQARASTLRAAVGNADATVAAASAALAAAKSGAAEPGAGGAGSGEIARLRATHAQALADRATAAADLHEHLTTQLPVAAAAASAADEPAHE